MMSTDERIAYLARAVDDLRQLALDHRERITLLEGMLSDLVGDLEYRINTLCDVIQTKLDEEP